MAEIKYPDDLVRMIHLSVRERIDAIAEEEIEACSKRIKERIGEDIDKIALNIFKDYDAVMDGSTLTIRVSKPEVEKTLG